MKNAITISCFAALCVLSACHSHECPEGTPAIESLKSDKTSVSAGDDVTITLAVKNFAMAGHKDDDHDEDHHDESCANSGHAHLYLDSVDGELLGMALEASITVQIPASTSPGSHQIIARLQDVSHQPLSPSVQRSVAIEIK